MAPKEMPVDEKSAKKEQNFLALVTVMMISERSAKNEKNIFSSAGHHDDTFGLAKHKLTVPS